MWKKKRGRLYSPDKKHTSQLDYIIGLMRRNDEVYIHNEGRLWATWDHCLIYARIQEDVHSKFSIKKRGKMWSGWTPKTEEQSVEFNNRMMEKNDNAEDDLATVQRNIKSASGKVVYHTKAEREKKEHTRKCQAT